MCESLSRPGSALDGDGDRCRIESEEFMTSRETVSDELLFLNEPRYRRWKLLKHQAKGFLHEFFIMLGLGCGEKGLD